MGRRRKAWLANKTGRRIRDNRVLPGFYVLYNNYSPPGHRIQHSKTFGSSVAAREFVKQYNARSDLKELGRVIPIPFAEAAEEFIKACGALRTNTRLQYAGSLGLFYRSVGAVNVCELDGAHIDKFITDRLSGAGAATAAKHVRAISRFLNWAVEKRGYAEINAVKLATSLPTSRSARERPVITDEDLGRLIKALDTEDRQLAVWLGMTTGADRGVIENLTADRINLEDRCIFKIRPKTGRRVTFPIHESLIPLLRVKLAKTLAGQPLLQGLSRQEKHEDWWHLAVAKAGLPEGTLFRDLRAVAAARLQRQGATLADAQHLLGHASPETTARHYTIPDPSIVRAMNLRDLPGLPRTRAVTAKKSASASLRRSRRREARLSAPSSSPRQS